MRGVSGDDPDGGAGVASCDCGANRTAGGPGSRLPGLRPGAGKSLVCSGRTAGEGQHGSPAENRHGGAPRGRPGCAGRPASRSRGCRASQARQIKIRECACRRSIHPSFGVRCKNEDTTRTPQGAAGHERCGMREGTSRIDRSLMGDLSFIGNAPDQTR